MTHPMTALWAAGLLALAAAGPARGDYFTIWTADDPTAFSDNSGMQVTLAGAGKTGPVSGPVSTVAATLSTFVNPGVTGTDSFSQGQTLMLGLLLSDGAEAGKVTFRIGVSGTLSAGGANQLSYSFPDGLAQTVGVNGTDYLVSLDPSAISSGGIGAAINPLLPAGGGDIGGGTDGAAPESAPEPSSAALACCGAAVALALRKKWRSCR